MLHLVGLRGHRGGARLNRLYRLRGLPVDCQPTWYEAKGTFIRFREHRRPEPSQRASRSFLRESFARTWVWSPQ